MIDKDAIERFKTQHILTPLNSREELRDWFLNYFDIYFPMGHVYPDSNSSPIDAAWRIYELMKTGGSKDIPQVAIHSSRDSFKTLIASAIEVLCMIHFRICVANASSILSQSEKTVEYINSFFRKIKPYLEGNGWKKTSDNKRKIEWITDKDEVIYVQVLVMSMRGMNSSHLPMLFIDEADLVQDMRALDESKMIPSTYKQYFPLTCILSTLKFSGGIMEKLLKETRQAGGEIYKWNIIDVTERITPEQAQSHLPKVVRYITSNLPMQNISPDEWEKLKEDEQNKFERFEAYAGIATHPMLPVMRNYLVDRNQADYKFLYKPLAAVHNNFKVTSVEMANAQLLCLKPSSSNLIYPRFDERLNTISVAEAWEKITGQANPTVSQEMLRDFILSLGSPIVGGIDFGYTDATSYVILAQIPGGIVWLVDHFMSTGLEPDDVVKYALEFQEKWQVNVWWTDQNRPDIVKTMTKKGLKAPNFEKVVSEGISALQTRIVDSSNVRRFFVLDIPENKDVIEMFSHYKWALDGKGEIIEGKPHHDRDGWSDIADSIRYPMQNLFGQTKISFAMVESDKRNEFKKTVFTQAPLEQVAKEINNQIMQEKMKELVVDYKPPAKKNAKKILFM